METGYISGVIRGQGTIPRAGATPNKVGSNVVRIRRVATSRWVTAVARLMLCL